MSMPVNISANRPASINAQRFWSLMLTMAILAMAQVWAADDKPSETPSANANAGAAFDGLHALEANDKYEPAILSVLESLSAGDLDAALETVDKHLIAFPKSRIGHFLRADILNAQGGALNLIGEGSAIPKSDLQGITHQLKNRWSHHKQHHEYVHDKLPAALLHIGQHPYVLVADMQKGRLYVYENNEGRPELVRDYYMSVGSAGFGKQIEGDNKTPVGVYHVNRYIEGKRLPDLYGKGAFPVNYPNKYDRFLKRTGYGIWLHGTPSTTYARAPWTSEGCFVLSNDDLLDIAQFLDPELKTPVILSDHINWVTRAELNQRRKQFLSIVERWKNDWESIDTEKYLAHYTDKQLNFGKTKYASWASSKRNLNAAKTFIQVDLEVQEMFIYPGEPDMFVVSFKQNYFSNNFQSQAEKRQFWKRSDDGQWKIIYEG